MDCVFCRILAGELPGTFVHRDELVSAFLDIQPVTPGHLLIVPNRHAEFLHELPPDAAGRVFHLAQRMAAALRGSGLRCEGVNLFLADGAAAGQEIAHAHLHVFPRFAGDGFGLKFPPYYEQQPTRADLEAAAGRIRASLPGASQ